MKFRTEVTVRRATFTLNPSRPVVLTGSCFSDNIAARMRDCLWEAENPLGTLYNPVSISEALMMSIRQDTEAFASTLFRQNIFYHSHAFDSSYSGRSEEECLDLFSGKSGRLRSLLDNAGALFVTFGSSLVYRLNEAPGNPIVGNCHKQPSGMFTRSRLTVNEIVSVWNETLAFLAEKYPGLKIIFTVSPVRHLRDGAEANSRSKAILLLAVEELCGLWENASYFPAYEIMMDDLRDYRFYDSDLVHPSAQGIDYIWERLKEAYLDERGLKLLKEGESIRRAMQHRPLIAETGEESIARRNEIEDRLKKFRSLQAGLTEKEKG